jgi:hypothetical protein
MRCVQGASLLDDGKRYAQQLLGITYYYLAIFPYDYCGV